MAVFHAYNAMASPGPPPLAVNSEDGDAAAQVEESKGKAGDATTADNVSSAVAAASSGAQTRLRKAQLFLEVRFDCQSSTNHPARQATTAVHVHTHTNMQTYKHAHANAHKHKHNSPPRPTCPRWPPGPVSPIHNPLSHPYTPYTPHTRAPQVAAGSSIAVVCLSLLFGLGGYLSFRDDTKVDILENIAGSVGAAFRIIFALFLTLDIPLYFLVLRHSLLNIVDVRVKDLSTWTFTAVTMLFLGFVLMVAVLLQVTSPPFSSSSHAHHCPFPMYL